MKSAQATCPGDVLKDNKDVSVAKNICEIVNENTNRESTPKEEETKNNTNNLKVSPQFLLLSTVVDY